LQRILFISFRHDDATLPQPTQPPPQAALSADQSGSDSVAIPAVDPPPAISRWAFRLIALAVASLPMTALLVAGRLQPSADGLGTHQQLGLPPCSMRVIFGVRCPSCGMTTSWAYFMNGHLVDSFRANPGGFLLAIFGFAFVLVALKAAWTGRLPSVGTQRLFGVSLLAIAGVTLVDWTLRLVG
jgi:hypothetical protein